MRMRRRGPAVEPVLFFLATTSRAAHDWAEQRGVPSWIEELPAGWVLMRSAAVDGVLAGTGVASEQALTEWARLAPHAYLLDDSTLRTVRDGRVIEVDDDWDVAPWEADDPRQARGVTALRADRTADLVIVATAAEEPVHAVLRDGWTMLPHPNPAAVAEAFPAENSPAFALHRLGDELHLWLFADDEPLGDWTWSVRGELAAIDRLPAGAVGDEVRDLVYPARLGIEPFLDADLQPAPELAQILGTDAPAADVVPQLVRALGLPDAARAHLLGETDLATAPDVRTVAPADSLLGAVRGSLAADSRQRASARSPRRRLRGAVGSIAMLGFGGLLLTLIIQDLRDGLEVSWWDWGRLGLVVAAGVGTLPAVRNWWVLRGTGQRDPAELPPDPVPDYRESPLGRWFNRRGPSTAVAALIGLLFAAVGVGAWIDDAPLRDRGIETTAQVVDSDQSGGRIVEFRTSDGTPVRTTLDGGDELEVGQSVQVVYDPQQPSHVRMAEGLTDPVGAIILGAGALVSFAVAVLTWTRVIDWQRVAAWV